MARHPASSATPSTGPTRPARAAGTARASAASLARITATQAESLGYLVIRCGQEWNQQAIARVNAEAGTPVLRDAHTRLFPYLTAAGGVRIIDLAAALGVSKQAVQPLVAELESHGFVNVQRDPADARARRVFLTTAGAAAFAHGTGILVDIERLVAERLGHQRLARLKRDLAALLDALASGS